MKFEKQEHIDLLKQMIEEELSEFQPDENSASDLRHKANLLEINEIINGKEPLDEIFVEKRKVKHSPEYIKKHTANKKKKSVCKDKIDRKTGPKRKYTPEIIDSIRKMKGTMCNAEIVKELKRKYGIETNESCLSVRLSQWGITNKKKPIHIREKEAKQLKVQEDFRKARDKAENFIKNNLHMSTDKLKGEIKEKFGLKMEGCLIDSVKQKYSEKEEEPVKDDSDDEITEELMGDEESE